MDIEYDDLKPGISKDERRHGVARLLQIAAGVLLLLAGIVFIFFPGPGVLTAVVGLNLIKPDNAIVRWVRRKVPGIPEDGTVPKRYLVIGALFFAVTTTLSFIYGDAAFEWVKSFSNLPENQLPNEFGQWLMMHKDEPFGRSGACNIK